MEQRDVFAFYQEYIKPIYCEIEATNNNLPVELLFEIHAAFDHLKRFHLEGLDEEECCKKAISHRKRGSLDAFKLKLKDFNRDINAIMNKGVDLSLIDNGQFLTRMTVARTELLNIARNARMSEGKHDREKAFEPWLQTSLKIDEFREEFLSNHHHFAWAEKKTFHLLNKDTLRGVIIGLITGLASSYAIWYLTRP